MMPSVSDQRLTRKELGWLLMQEARGTARALRNEVTQLSTNGERPSDHPIPVDTMLDALDGTIEMMSALESPSGLSHAGEERRCRIDLAGILCDIVPDGRIAIEVGGGMEIQGSVAELRRMLGVLVAPSSGGTATSSMVQLRREGDWVVVSTELGPEGPRARDLELRWLHRMALQYGGRVEYRGARILLFLPADVSNQRELEQLREELAQAQQLGEVYARELAEAFTSQGTESSVPVPSAVPENAQRLDLLVTTATAISRTLHLVTDSIRTLLPRLGTSLVDPTAAAQELKRASVTLFDLALELDRLSQIDTAEKPIQLDLTALVTETLERLETKAAQREVKLVFAEQASHPLVASAAVLTLVIRVLLEQACLASPRGGRVEVSIHDRPGALLLCVSDGGPVLPESAHEALLSGHADPSSLGRPHNLGWLLLGEGAKALGATVTLGTSPSHRAQTELSLPR